MSNVHGFSEEWTARDSPPGPVQLGILAVALVQDVCPDCIQLIHGGAVDHADDAVQKEDEVYSSFRTKVDKVKACYGVEINDRWFYSI